MNNQSTPPSYFSIHLTLPFSAKSSDFYLQCDSSLRGTPLKIPTTFIGKIKAEENET